MYVHQHKRDRGEEEVSLGEKNDRFSLEIVLTDFDRLWLIHCKMFGRPLLFELLRLMRERERRLK